MIVYDEIEIGFGIGGFIVQARPDDPACSVIDTVAHDAPPDIPVRVVPLLPDWDRQSVRDVIEGMPDNTGWDALLNAIYFALASGSARKQ